MLAKTQKLPYAHYSDLRWVKPQLIYSDGYQGKCEGGNYSDRLQQWDFAKHRSAWAEAKMSNEPETPAFYEKYLSEYFGKTCVLRAIFRGVNQSNGYSYDFYAYDFA